MPSDDDRRIRVAVVERRLLLLDGIVATLAAQGFSIVLATADWYELRDFSAPFDVAVIGLGRYDDLPIRARVQTLAGRGHPSVVVSGSADAGAVREAMDAGAMGFVSTRQPAGDLAVAIRSAVRRRRHLPSALAALLAHPSAGADPPLGSRERLALTLYATGRSLKEVALSMGTTEETVKSYIKRGRKKYLSAGIDVSTKLLLRRHGIRQGWVSPD